LIGSAISLRSHFFSKLRISLLSIFVFIALLFFACREEGDLKPNSPPETVFSIEEINVTGDMRLNSIVRLSWYGSDPDGYVKAYEISQDQVNWTSTTSQDSTFRFSISANSDTVDIDLYVRSIDDDDVKDPTPAYLRIPIKNTPPVAKFSEDLVIPDSAFLVATTEWSATDLDGVETITDVYLSINGKTWYPLNKTEKVISIVPADFNATDTTNAFIYYGSRTTPAAETIEGLVLNDTNKLYIKAVDQAGAESIIDTSSTFYMRTKQNDLLVVGGVAAAHDDYKALLNAPTVNLDYDFLNLTVGNGIYQPALWNITFRLQLSFYDKLFFYSDETTFINPYTNLRLMLLEFAASSLQEYANSGGKYLISTSFDWDTNIEGFRGVLPIESVSQKNYGDARLYQDSSILPENTTYPTLSASAFALTGVGVFNIDSNDTEVFYQGQISDRPVSGNRFPEWPDTKIVASARRSAGKLNQIFFTMQLYELDGDQVALESLFDEIFNVEFN